MGRESEYNKEVQEHMQQEKKRQRTEALAEDLFNAEQVIHTKFCKSAYKKIELFIFYPHSLLNLVSFITNIIISSQLKRKKGVGASLLSALHGGRLNVK